MLSAVLPYRPPYPWESVLRFLAARALPNIETAENGVYSRFVCLCGAQGRIFVENAPEQNALSVSADDSLAAVLPDVLSRLRVMFDLDCNPAAVFEQLSFLNEIKDGACVIGTRSVGCFDVFETAVRTVLGQQITVKAAQTLAARFITALGEKTSEGIVFPSPAKIAALPEQTLTALGIMPTRAKAISAIAEGLSKRTLDLSPVADARQSDFGDCRRTVETNAGPVARCRRRNRNAETACPAGNRTVDGKLSDHQDDARARCFSGFGLRRQKSTFPVDLQRHQSRER